KTFSTDIVQKFYLEEYYRDVKKKNLSRNKLFSTDLLDVSSAKKNAKEKFKSIVQDNPTEFGSGLLKSFALGLCDVASRTQELLRWIPIFPILYIGEIDKELVLAVLSQVNRFLFEKNSQFKKLTELASDWQPNYSVVG